MYKLQLVGVGFVLFGFSLMTINLIGYWLIKWMRPGPISLDEKWIPNFSQKGNGTPVFKRIMQQFGESMRRTMMTRQLERCGIIFILLGLFLRVVALLFK